MIFQNFKKKNNEADKNLNDDVENKELEKEESSRSPRKEEVAPRPARTKVIKNGPSETAKYYEFLIIYFLYSFLSIVIFSLFIVFIYLILFSTHEFSFKNPSLYHVIMYKFLVNTNNIFKKKLIKCFTSKLQPNMLLLQ